MELYGTTGLAHGLTTPPFSWSLYLNSTPWGRALLTEKVTSFALCWLADKERPGFHVTKLDGQMVIIDPIGKGAPWRLGSEGVCKW